MSVTVYTSKNASVMLGGTTPQFQYNASNNETGSCTSAPTPSAWTDVNITNPGSPLCTLFRFDDGTDSINIGVRVNFSYDAPSGVRSATFTAVGTGL